MSNFYLLITLFISFHIGYGLYEDQVGKFDWKLSFVGKVKESHIDFKSKVKRVFVSTENNTVACLSLKSGSIVWRQVLESGENGKIRKMFRENDIVYTLSGRDQYMVRGWNSLTGILVSEWILEPSEVPMDHFVLENSKLTIVTLLDKTLLLSYYNIKDGSAAGSIKTITAPWFSPQFKCAVYKSGLICISESGTLTQFEFSANAPSTHHVGSTPSSLKVVVSPLPAVQLGYEDGSSKLAVIKSQNVILSTVSASSSLAVHSFGSSYIALTVLQKDGVYHVDGFDIETKRAVSEVSGRAQHTFPLEDAAVSSVFCVEDRVSCYLILVGEDSSLALVNAGRVVWLREEALSNVVSVEMIDLPVSDTEAAIEKEFNNKEDGVIGMLMRRVLSQLSQLQTYLGLGDDSSDSRSTLVRDVFGLHKLIVVVTSVAKVYGIDNENGEIVWQYQVEGVKPCLSLGKSSAPFYVQRTARHHPYPAICTILFKSLINKNTILFVFNPINGQPLEGGVIDTGVRVAQASLLPENNQEFIRGLLLLSHSNSIQVFPPSAKSVALALADSLFIFTANNEKNDIFGYWLGLSTTTELIATKLWSLKLTGELLSVTSKNPNEKVHSQGRVLSDRSVLYKYINPNLVAFATFSSDPIHKGIMNMYLVDVVKGDIKFMMTHKRVGKPVHVVHSENWLVYTFYNDKYRRSELITLELYEGKEQSNSTEFSSLKDHDDPLVERQAYIFPHHVLAMKETITEKGITNKHVLVGMENGGVLEVPWALLNPRRPLNPTPEAREEGVIPYVPELMLPAEAIITYNQTVPNIIGIHTSPSALESTCLVFVYGLDFFYTRVMPSKTFDVLKDDFDYWLITVVLVGLTSAAWLTKRLSSRKTLRHSWK